MRQAAIGFALLIVLTVSAAGAAAQSEQVRQTINVYEAIVTYPGPVWYVEGDPIDASEHYRKQTGPVFVFEQIPKGQKFDSWTSLYAVRGYYLAARPDLTMDQFVSANLLLPYEEMCGRKNIAIEVLERLTDRFMLLFVCQNSASGPAAMGYRDGIGELSVYRAFKVKSTFVEVFQKWRGPSFTVGDNSTWPVALADVNHVVARLRTASATADPAQR